MFRPKMKPAAEAAGQNLTAEGGCLSMP